MFKRKNSPAHSEVLIKKALREIEKQLVEMEKEGKDLTKMKLKKYTKTHHAGCKCTKCLKATKAKDPTLRGLREYGFKVYVQENDKEET
ncbi:MAG: hypothetical protein QNL04_03420 [SAR324 cluster bacterium]|nr:hypothetical protein [SAR324 cluster bacterium]